jgi:putative SOS response-associated peptidase YedK
VVRQAKDGGGRELVLMQWGLILWFSKDGKLSYSTINARAEAVQSNALYREPFKKGRRCIMPASGSSGRGSTLCGFEGRVASP